MNTAVSADGRRWDERHADATPPAPGPPDGLVERADLIPPAGRCLDLACGLGAQAVWAALCGHEVLAIDASPLGLAKARRLAIAHQVSDRIFTRVLDLTTEPVPEGAFDLVICQRYRQPELYPRIAAALAPGGRAVISVLSQVDGPLEPGPFHAPPGELLDVFTPNESTGPGTPLVNIVHHREADGQSTIIIERA